MILGQSDVSYLPMLVQLPLQGSFNEAIAKNENGRNGGIATLRAESRAVLMRNHKGNMTQDTSICGPHIARNLQVKPCLAPRSTTRISIYL